MRKNGTLNIYLYTPKEKTKRNELGDSEQIKKSNIKYEIHAC